MPDFPKERKDRLSTPKKTWRVLEFWRENQVLSETESTILFLRCESGSWEHQI